MTQAAHEIVVDRPVAEVYGEWADDRSLCGRFGDDIDVEAVAEATTSWTLPLAARRRRIVVREIESYDGRDIVWLSLSGPRLAGRVSFRPLGAGSTRVRLSVDFDPRNPLGRIAGSFGVPGRAVARVLERFKDSVEGERRDPGRASRTAGPAYEVQDHPHPPGETAPRGPTLHDASGPGVSGVAHDGTRPTGHHGRGAPGVSGLVD